MSMNDTLAAALSNILNAEKTGKALVTTKPVAKMTLKILEIMKDKHYIGDYKTINDGKGGIIEINLIGEVNKCGAIKPRFSVTKETAEKFEKRFLPAKGFGMIIISTSQGVMTLDEAKEKNIGGKLIAYIY